MGLLLPNFFIFIKKKKCTLSITPIVFNCHLSKLHSLRPLENHKIKKYYVSCAHVDLASNNTQNPQTWKINFLLILIQLQNLDFPIFKTCCLTQGVGRVGQVLDLKVLVLGSTGYASQFESCYLHFENNIMGQRFTPSWAHPV